MVQVYLGTAQGIPAKPSFTINKFTGQNDYDWFGWRVAAAGDFDGDGLQDLAVLSRYGSMANYADAHFAANGCNEPRRYNAGAMHIFRGYKGQTPPTDPAFVFIGPQQYRRLDSLAAGFDFNGDKKSDVIVGGYDLNGAQANSAGGFAIVAGRAAVPGKISVICDPALISYGVEPVGYLGIAVTGMKDIDGDGCDEVVAGAYEEHLAGNDMLAYQGTARTHPAGTGQNTADWIFIGLQPGWYDVRLTWPTAADQAPDATYTIYDGTTSRSARLPMILSKVIRACPTTWSML